MDSRHAGGNKHFLYATGDEHHRLSLQAKAADILSEIAAMTKDSAESLPEVLPVEAAVACGSCRLYGGEPPEVSFPAWLAVPAASRLKGLIEESTADTKNLPAAWDVALPDEAEDLVASLLFARMDSWAAFETLDAAMEGGGDDVLSEQVAACQGALARFDEALWDRLDFLSTLGETQLLVNWRLSLAAPYREPLPWWLSGTLEAAAVAVDRSIDAMKREIFGSLRTVSPVEPARPRVRERIQQVYAAAADVWASAAGALTPLFRWRSPDGSLTAKLLPPPGGPQVEMPDSLLMTFATTDGDSPNMLRGCVAVLSGRANPIAWRLAGGTEVAVANFPAEAILDADEEDRAADLIVFPDADPWEPV